MRNIVLFFGAILFSCCDTRRDFNVNLNTAPQLSIRHDDSNFNALSSYQTILTDSFKLSQGNYYFDYNLQDNEALQSVRVITNILGNGVFQTLSLTSSQRFVFNPKTTGFQSIQLKAIDGYGLSGDASIRLTTFKDLAPVAYLTYLQTAVYDPLEFRLQADQSYDRDAKFGGRIINYEFSISPDYQVITPSNFISYIFPGTGNFQISLRVEDNDSVWSSSFVSYINVN